MLNVSSHLTHHQYLVCFSCDSYCLSMCSFNPFKHPSYYLSVLLWNLSGTKVSLTEKPASFSVSLQQLRANIREMEKLCSRVRAEDADPLEELVKPVRDRASAAARDFLLLHSNPMPQPAPAPPPAAQSSSCVSSSCHADYDVGEEPVSGRQIQLHLPEIPADQSAAESWDNLEEVCMSGPYHFLHVLNSTLTCNLFFFCKVTSCSLLLYFCYRPFFLRCEFKVYSIFLVYKAGFSFS